MTTERKNSLRWRDLPWLAIVVPLVLVLSVPMLLWFSVHLMFYGAVLLAIWLRWLPQGKDVLVVYSNSPHWQTYFESAVIPQLKDRCLTLNWSERAIWSKQLSLRRFAFHCFSGSHEYNPAIIVFALWRWPKKFRLYKAFRDLKHRNHATMQRVIQDLSECLDEPIPVPPLPPQPSA